MRLVLQHPRLNDAIVTEASRTLGALPSRRTPTAASWPVSPDDPSSLAAKSQWLQALGDRLEVDAALVPEGRRLADYRLIVFDMDSTLITIECIDEIADFAGVKPEVAAITEAAMRGEIRDYAESLRRRVALLAGLPQTVLQRVYDERLQLSPGAQTLVGAAKAAGLKVLLVSGGFDFFTSRLRERLALDFVRSNALEVIDGKLTGRVTGEIVDAEVKRTALLETCNRLGCTPPQAIAVGDGANDLKMMEAAGLSVAYHAKPVVRERCTHALSHMGLDGVLALFED
jgi:phosphoserine phosphatase